MIEEETSRSLGHFYLIPPGLHSDLSEARETPTLALRSHHREFHFGGSMLSSPVLSIDPPQFHDPFHPLVSSQRLLARHIATKKLSLHPVDNDKETIAR